MIARFFEWLKGLFSPGAPQLTGPVGAPPTALPAGSDKPGTDGWVHPTGGQGRLSSPFGARIHPITKKPQNHNGQDLAVPTGTPIMAVKAGKVTMRKDSDPIAGRYVGIDHGGGFITQYLHLSRADVKVGDTVKQGQVIGLSGGAKGADGAGRSTGPHLHFIVKKDGTAVDPPSIISLLKLTPKK